MIDDELPPVIIAYEYRTSSGNRRRWKYPHERFGPKHWDRYPDGHAHDMVKIGTYVLKEEEPLND